jgi:hypothetical protein
MRPAETIEDYDLVALGENVEHLRSRVGDRLKEPLVELSPCARAGFGSGRREGGEPALVEFRVEHIFEQVELAAVENFDQSQRDGLVRFEVKRLRGVSTADCLCFRCHVRLR